MLENDDARIPFAAIGVLLVLLSTIVTVYLASMESAGVMRDIADDRDRDVSRALTLAVSDIGTAMNYAGLVAEAEVGKRPIVNTSNGSSFAMGAKCVDDERIKLIAWQELSKYLDVNYNGSFAYGDYTVTATLTRDYRSLALEPDNMTMGRTLDHPLAPCRMEYTTYYTMTAPVRLTVERPGSDFTYSEDRVIRSLITARYPLLRDLTGEFERRLNGTPMSLDLTAASFALTWARGYVQYASGAPLNIVDNSQVELIVNGALLTEEGFEYNSVDPLGLATFAYNCLGNAARPSEVNSYNISNVSETGLDRSADPPEKYTFSADEMADRAYENVSFGGYAESTREGAYTMQMYVEIARDKDYYPRINATYTVEDDQEPISSTGPGIRSLLKRTFRAYGDNSDGNGFADRVTVTYFVSRYSALQYFGTGRYTESTENLDDPLLAGSSNDVVSPFVPYIYERDLSFGQKAFTDDNLREAIKWYEASFDLPGETGRFERVLADIIGDHDGWQSLVPAAFTDQSYEFVCGPDNRYPVWVEIEADYELRDLINLIKREMTIDLDPEDYGGSPAEMTATAYKLLYDRFMESYDRYLDRQSYFCTPPQGDYCNLPAYRSCGLKAIFRVRQAFLTDLSRQLEDAANNAGNSIDRAIDDQLNGTGLSTSNLMTGATGAKSYLAERLYIPFGLSMDLNSSREFARGYPWDEEITIAVDQSPSYLDTGRHVDEETGYSVRTLRLRNVCLFSPAAEISWSDEIADAMAAPVMAGIDAIAASVDNITNETVIAEVDKLTVEISSGVRDALKNEIASVLGDDAGYGEAISQESIDGAIDRAYQRRNGDSKAVIKDLCNGTLVKEIADDLIDYSASSIKENARKVAEGYVDEYTLYIERKIEEKITGAGHKAIVQVTVKLKDEVRNVFRDFAREAAQDVAGKVMDAGLSRALGMVPSGLPLLPPWGWWATLNVWYIEVEGVIPVFTVYDADVEAIPDPVFGGRAIEYTRRHETITDEQDHIIGMNEPIRFSARTGTFIIVPPGAQGVGDKTGGWDEKSQGFDEKER